MMTLVSRLRAAAHFDRLRILGLCAHADLTVCELADILDLRRDRIVRHVGLLARADFLCCEEHRPLKPGDKDGGLVQLLVDLLPLCDGHHERDLQRLEAIQSEQPKGDSLLDRQIDRPNWSASP
ncbi:ArsR family transcriptional regulator [Mesorhizobium hawassense]|uniref:ArsR family transcriptional regulator n=1 Tax=Mesorhizobium hawassense TaxID=1209954 RepID=A0A330H388_9HYPH|nr:ArsR family transcriptional regulator [Mesorhizobium hawassense]